MSRRWFFCMQKVLTDANCLSMRLSEESARRIDFMTSTAVLFGLLASLSPKGWLHRFEIKQSQQEFCKVFKSHRKRLTGQREWGRWCSVLHRLPSPSSIFWPSVMFVMLSRINIHKELNMNRSAWWALDFLQPWNSEPMCSLMHFQETRASLSYP